MQPTAYSGLNADDMTTTFGMGFNIINAPGNGGYLYINIPYDGKTIGVSDYACQIAIPVQFTDLLPMYRQKSSKVWTPWKNF